MTKKLTKIVATISDKNCDVDFLQSLYNAGMNVVRLNTAHQNYNDTLKIINNVRKVSDKIALLLDTKGPEIRTTKADVDIHVKNGDKIYIKGDPEKITNRELICVSYINFVKDVSVGCKILIDDGEVELSVIEKIDDKLLCEVQNDGIIQGRKSVNIPSVNIKLPSLSEKDKGYINFAIENNIDFIAHSFVRKKEDILAIKEILDKKNANIKIIAKIENQEGVDNIDEIIDHSSGIMIARGDLAIEIPRERIPIIQKIIINKCIDKRKQVITATQMLHTMINNPRPTRAEVSDVANAIYDGSDAIMLSGETAYGKYALESVQTMTKIAFEIEKNNVPFKETQTKNLSTEVSAYLAKSAVKASIRLSSEAIVADTFSGRTIRNLAGFRGNKPVYALCYSKKTMRELALSYGVYAYYMEPRNTADDFLQHALAKLTNNKCLTNKSLIVVLAGNFGRSQGATFIEISNVEHLINRHLIP